VTFGKQKIIPFSKSLGTIGIIGLVEWLVSFGLGFPIWFLAHDRRGLFFVILVIFVLLHIFAILFSSPPLVFVRRRGCFDAIVGSNAIFLLEVWHAMLAWTARRRAGLQIRIGLIGLRGNARAILAAAYESNGAVPFQFLIYPSHHYLKVDRRKLGVDRQPHTIKRTCQA
jgi:hypothetical protein